MEENVEPLLPSLGHSPVLLDLLCRLLEGLVDRLLRHSLDQFLKLLLLQTFQFVVVLLCAFYIKTDTHLFCFPCTVHLEPKIVYNTNSLIPVAIQLEEFTL